MANVQNHRRHKKPVLRNRLCYTDEEKAESLVENFEKTHSTARNTLSPIDHKTYEPAHTKQHLEMYRAADKKLNQFLIKAGQKSGPDKMSTTALKKLPTKPIIQLYYIFPSYNYTIYFPTG